MNTINQLYDKGEEIEEIFKFCKDKKSIII